MASFSFSPCFESIRLFSSSHIEPTGLLFPLSPFHSLERNLCGAPVEGTASVFHSHSLTFSSLPRRFVGPTINANTNVAFLASLCHNVTTDSLRVFVSLSFSFRVCLLSLNIASLRHMSGRCIQCGFVVVRMRSGSSREEGLFHTQLGASLIEELAMMTSQMSPRTFDECHHLISSRDH